MPEAAWRWIQIVVLVLGMSGAYWRLDARVLLVEQAATQESIGYRLLVAELGKRLERMEDKIDRFTELIHQKGRQ